jgi:biotin operon repressor
MLNTRNVTTAEIADALGITRNEAAKHVCLLRKQGQAVMVSPPRYGKNRSTAVWGKGQP